MKRISSLMALSVALAGPSISLAQTELPEARDETEARNLETMRRWAEEVWIDGRLELVPELVATRYVRRESEGTRVLSPAEYAKEIEANRERGMEFVLHASAIDGDLFWSRWSLRVKGPEGEEVVGKGFQTHRFEDGKLSETWLLYTFDGPWPDQ